jgi:hypothetical protein
MLNHDKTVVLLVKPLLFFSFFSKVSKFKSKKDVLVLPKNKNGKQNHE